jgi:hypothetical protein
MPSSTRPCIQTHQRQSPRQFRIGAGYAVGAELPPLGRSAAKTVENGFHSTTTPIATGCVQLIRLVTLLTYHRRAHAAVLIANVIDR